MAGCAKDNVQRGRRPARRLRTVLLNRSCGDALDLRNRSLVDEDVVLTVESLVAAPCDLGQSATIRSARSSVLRLCFRRRNWLVDAVLSPSFVARFLL
jgi:hypothetical protein